MPEPRFFRNNDRARLTQDKLIRRLRLRYGFKGARRVRLKRASVFVYSYTRTYQRGPWRRFLLLIRAIWSACGSLLGDKVIPPKVLPYVSDRNVSSYRTIESLRSIETQVNKKSDEEDEDPDDLTTGPKTQ